MFLGELLLRKESMKDQIDELKAYIRNDVSKGEVTAALEKLFKLEDKLQAYNITLNKVNNQTEINIGETGISVVNAILLRDTIERKINTLTMLIEISSNVNVLSLIDQRNKFLEEYILFDRVINISDWKVEVE
jgi:hypothetical protein